MSATQWHLIPQVRLVDLINLRAEVTNKQAITLNSATGPSHRVF